MAYGEPDVTVNQSGGNSTGMVAIIALIIILVLVGAYFLFFNQPVQTVPAAGDGAGDTNITVEDETAPLGADAPAGDTGGDVNIGVNQQQEEAPAQATPLSADGGAAADTGGETTGGAGDDAGDDTTASG